MSLVLRTPKWRKVEFLTPWTSLPRNYIEFREHILLIIQWRYEFVLNSRSKSILNYRFIQLVICIVLDETPSGILLKITLNHVPENRYSKSYSLSGIDCLKNGIRSDSMICTGSIKDGEDTCQVRRFLQN